MTHGGASSLAVMGRDVLVLLRLISLQNVWAHNTLEIVVRRQWDDDQAGPHEVAANATYKDTVRSVSLAGVVWSLPVAHRDIVYAFLGVRRDRARVLLPLAAGQNVGRGEAPTRVLDLALRLSFYHG